MLDDMHPVATKFDIRNVQHLGHESAKKQRLGFQHTSMRHLNAGEARELPLHRWKVVPGGISGDAVMGILDLHVQKHCFCGVRSGGL